MYPSPTKWLAKYFLDGSEPSGTRDTPDDFCHDMADSLFNH